MPGRPANARGRRRPRCTRTTPSCEKKMRNSNLKKETFFKEEIGKGRAADIGERSEEFFVGSKSIWKKLNPRSLPFYSETSKRCRNIPTVAFKLKKNKKEIKKLWFYFVRFSVGPDFFQLRWKKTERRVVSSSPSLRLKTKKRVPFLV